MSKKILKLTYPTALIKRARFQDYDFVITYQNKTHYIKKLDVNSRTILSINSKTVWEIRKGKVSGISFKASGSELIDMKEFGKRENKIIVFNSSPYKILKYINESEVVDISTATEIQDIKIYHSLKDIKI